METKIRVMTLPVMNPRCHLGEEVEGSVTFEKELSSLISDSDISNKGEGIVSFVFSLPDGTLEKI